MAEQDKSTKFPTATCRVFISYSHDSTEHERRVRALADRLRADGVDAWIDQYTQDPDEGWPNWMRSQVKQANRVLLVFTETYQRRFEGNEEEGKGLGAAFEGVIVTQWLYESGGRNAKFRPVVLTDKDAQFIPVELRRFTRYRVDTPENYEALRRWLHEAPSIVAPMLGQKPDLRPEDPSDLFPSKSDKVRTPAQDALIAPSEGIGNQLLAAGASSYDHGQKLLSQALPEESVRFLEDDTEVREWVNFDDEVYEPGVITYELLWGWWSKYHKGAIGLFKNNRIDAILAIWPLKKETFDQILTGAKGEKEIGPDDIVAEPQSKCCQTWYVSGFAVRQNLRSTDEVSRFVRKAIEKWKSSVFLSFPLELCAFGYRIEGERSLKRFGFSLKKLASEKGTWPLYHLQIVDQEALQERLSRIKIKRQSSRAKASHVESSAQPNTRLAGRQKTRVVVIMHGIRDEAEWMTELRRLIENESHAKVATLHPERISLTRFLLAARYLNYIKKYRDLVSEVLAEYKEADVVFIAHSYGTWCLADIIRNWSHRENLRPVAIILCGSILPKDTPWSAMWNRVFRRYRDENELPWVWNDIGGSDPFPLLARLVSKDYGDAGVSRFSEPQPGLVVNRIHAGVDHGGFFIKQEAEGKTALNKEFIRRFWLPVIRGEDGPRYGEDETTATSVKRLSYWVKTSREVAIWFVGLQIIGWSLVTFGNSQWMQPPGRILVVSAALIPILWLWNGVRENPSPKKAPLARSSAVFFSILIFIAGILWIATPLLTTVRIPSLQSAKVKFEIAPGDEGGPEKRFLFPQNPNRFYDLSFETSDVFVIHSIDLSFPSDKPMKKDRSEDGYWGHVEARLYPNLVNRIQVYGAMDSGISPISVTLTVTYFGPTQINGSWSVIREADTTLPEKRYDWKLW